MGLKKTKRNKKIVLGVQMNPYNNEYADYSIVTESNLYEFMCSGTGPLKRLIHKLHRDLDFLKLDEEHILNRRNKINEQIRTLRTQIQELEKPPGDGSLTKGAIK